MASSNAAKRLMIFGGTGVVGSAIAREAARRGLLVQCVTRGGDAPAHLRSEPWAASVTWLRGDALDPGTYAEHMRGADAVITSVDRLPFPHLTRDVIVRDNGETNVAPARCAAEVGVDRLVVIGASVPKMIPGVGWDLRPAGVHDAGYAAGKAMAEAHARDELWEATRRRAAAGSNLGLSREPGSSDPGHREVPLWAALGPVASVMRAPPPDAVADEQTVDNVARARWRRPGSIAGAYCTISNAELIERFGDESSR